MVFRSFVKTSQASTARLEPFRLKSFLEGLYFVYNRRELVYPDPLVFLYEYENPADREIVGLISSCLAYGRVAQILKSVEKVLSPMEGHPHRFLQKNQALLDGLYRNFKHRFTTGNQISALLKRTSQILNEYGTLEVFLKDCLSEGKSLTQGLAIFSAKLSPQREGFSLLPSPGDGSACKRLMLFLKWMTRKDDVDPGGWTVLDPAELIMPTDTHIHNIALRLGLTDRKQADFKTALEITHALSAITPEDPTRYDFVLSRFGIRSGMEIAELVELGQG